jgi:hypothetical protein
MTGRCGSIGYWREALFIASATDGEIPCAAKGWQTEGITSTRPLELDSARELAAMGYKNVAHYSEVCWDGWKLDSRWRKLLTVGAGASVRDSILLLRFLLKPPATVKQLLEPRGLLLLWQLAALPGAGLASGEHRG